MLTIVTVCRNNPIELARTIDSLYYSLDSPLLECLVIDGSDTNDKQCKLILDNYRFVKYHKQVSTGIYSAMNEGIKLASGDSIIFMNSGDYFSPKFNITNFVDNYNDKLASHVIFGDVIVFYEDFYRQKSWDTRKVPSVELLPSHQSTFTPIKHLKKEGFSEDYRVSSDSKRMIDIYAQCPFIHIPEVVSYFELGGVSTYPKTFKGTFNHSIEVINTRQDFSVKMKSKFVLKQITKVIVIKLFGYKNYLKYFMRF